MHNLIQWLARASALMGGMVLVALIVLMTTSITMRSLNLGEVNGAYEILEAGVGFAIFAFFPICQLHGAHATVDVFTSAMPARFNRILIAIWESRFDGRDYLYLLPPVRGNGAVLWAMAKPRCSCNFLFGGATLRR